MTTPREVNQRLSDLYGPGEIAIVRSPRGYYYFIGSHRFAMDIDSIYTYSLRDWDIDEVMEWVASDLRQLKRARDGNINQWR